MSSADVNKTIHIGNVGRSPEIANTTTGVTVCNFSIATNEKWTDKNSNVQERAEWHRIVAFGRLAELCDQYIDKGSRVYVEGRLQTRQWEDKDGQKRYTTEIVAREIKFQNFKDKQQSRDDDNRGNTIGGDDYPF